MDGYQWFRNLQFSTGGAAGGVFIGNSVDPGSDGSDVMGNTTIGNTTIPSDSEDGSVDVVTGLYVVAALIGSVVAIATFTWLLSYIADYYCCCLPWFRALSHNDIRWDHSRLAKQARLFGLTLPERRKVLDHVFMDQKLLYDPQKKQAKSTMTESRTSRPVAVWVGTTLDKNLTALEMGHGGPGIADSQDSQEEENPEITDDSMRPLDDGDHERLCCICLAEYKAGEQLLRGELCLHQFHYACCMDWLMVPRGHCPYCRQTLVTAQSFREAATLCLGSKRVAEMTGATTELVAIRRGSTEVAPGMPALIENGNNVETEMDVPDTNSPPVALAITESTASSTEVDAQKNPSAQKEDLLIETTGAKEKKSFVSDEHLQKDRSAGDDVARMNTEAEHVIIDGH